MCGRFQSALPPEEIARIFRTRNPVPNYPARYNVAPTDPVMAVRRNSKTGERSLDLLRWGLVPHWEKDLSSGAKRINARAEAIDRTPAFRDAFALRRCLIPASGFYEWRKEGKTRSPYAVMPVDRPLFAFAGLWENWRDRAAGADAPWIRSCTILTVPANRSLEPIHDRMPAILGDEGEWAKWLGDEPAGPEELKALLKPFAEERMRIHSVGPRVNNVRNDDAGLIEPVMAQGGILV
jgi:putative SOS response-associated peptidase YedK